MHEKAQELLIVMIITVSALAAYMLYRPKRHVSRLDLRNKLRQTEETSNLSGQVSSDLRELNIIFQYNGHDFDAYEVLGVPAGSSIDEVRRAHERALKTSDVEAKEMLDMALESVLKKRS